MLSPTRGTYRMYTTRPQLAIAVAILTATSTLSVCAATAEQHFAVGANHYANQRWAPAVEQFREFLAQYSNHSRSADVSFFLAEALVQLQSYREAHQQFRDYLRRIDGRTAKYKLRARFRLGETAYFSGEYDVARTELESFRTQFPNDGLQAYAIAYLGEIALKSDRIDEAETLYNEALDRYPRGPLSADCRFGLARIRQSRGDLAAARESYAQLVRDANSRLADRAMLHLALLEYNADNFADATRLLERLGSDYPHSQHRIAGRYWLGLAQLAQQDYESAADTLAVQADVDSRHPLAPAFAYYAGEALRHAGKDDEAATSYRRVIDTWPDSEFADDGICGQMYLALGRDDHEEVARLRSLLEGRYGTSPRLREARLIVARTLLNQQKYREAVALLRQVTTASAGHDGHVPVSSKELYYLSLALAGDKRYDESLQVLERIDSRSMASDLVNRAHVARATALLGLKRFADAEAPLRAYLRSQPEGEESASCRADLVVALTHSRQLRKAVQAYREYAEKHPEHAARLPTALYLAESLFQAGELSEAETLFADLSREGNPPEYVRKGLAGLAWIQTRRGRSQEAEETIQRLAEENAEDSEAPQLALARAQQLEQDGQREQAAAAYQLIVDRFAGSRQAPHAVLGAARLYDELNQKPKAAELLEKFVEQGSDADSVDAALYQLAWLWIDLKQEQQGDAAFSRLHRDYPQSQYWADATYRLAQRAMATENHERAEELIDQLIRSDQGRPLTAHALYLKGEIAAADERWDDVADSMQRIVDEFADAPVKLLSKYWVAEAHYRQERYDEAATRLRVLAEETGSFDDSWLGMIPLRLAQVLAHQKKWPEAQELASGIAARFPEFRQQHEVDFLIGRCLAAQGRFREARAAYQRVTSSATGGGSETAAMAQWMMGETYFHQKDYDHAIRAYLRVETIYDYPQWQAAGLLQAGKCYEIQHDVKSAVELYARLIARYPNTAFSKDAVDRLRRARDRNSMAATS